MPSSPSDLAVNNRSRSPHCSHGYEEEELQAHRQPIRDGRGRWYSQVSLTGEIHLFAHISCKLFDLMREAV